MSQEKI